MLHKKVTFFGQSNFLRGCILHEGVGLVLQLFKADFVCCLFIRNKKIILKNSRKKDLS